MSSELGGLATVAEAAKFLACTPSAVRRWIQQRRISVVRVGRLVRIRREGRASGAGGVGAGAESGASCFLNQHPTILRRAP